MSSLSRIVAMLWALVLPMMAAKTASAKELKTAYATIIYSDDELLSRFNRKIELTNQLRLMLRNKKILTLQDEVRGKVDLVVEKVESVLEMFPDSMQFSMDILNSTGDVQQIYLAKYGKRADHIAYYSLKEKTIYISAEDASLRVMAHEIGHVVVDHYYKIRTPNKIQEVLAHYAEKYTSKDD